MNLIRLAQVVFFGWRDSKKISKCINKKRICIYKDMVSCFCKYGIKNSDYMNNSFYLLDDEARRIKGSEFYELNKQRDFWYKRYYKNQKFLAKYTKLHYDTSLVRQHIRNINYKKHYGWDNLCWVHNNVIIASEHNHEGKFEVGQNVVLSNNVEIDYTGDLFIGNGVDIMDGSKILTHAHDFFGGVDEETFIPGSNRAYCTPLKIGDNVLIGSRCLIMPNVKEIGNNSIISAGSIVKKKIPANSIVAGNPAKIIGEISDGMRVYFAYNN